MAQVVLQGRALWSVALLSVDYEEGACIIMNKIGDDC